MTPLFTFSGFIKARERTTPGGGERRSRQKKQTQNRGFLEIKQEHKGETHRRNRGKAPGTEENRDNRRKKTETKNQRRGEKNENTGRKPRDNEQN